MLARLSRLPISYRDGIRRSGFRSYASYSSMKIFEHKNKPKIYEPGSVASFFNHQTPRPTATKLGLNNNRSANEKRAFSSTAKLQRKFIIDSAIPASQKKYEVLDMAEENEKSLLPLIRMGNHVMLQGAPASGKTTRALKAMDQLKEDYFCIYVNLESVESDNFWQSLGKALIDNKVQNPPRINCQGAFLELFQPSSKQQYHFNSKRVVLFIDGFDHLNKIPSEKREEFLIALQAYKVSSDMCCLHSVVAIGPYCVKNLGGDIDLGLDVVYPVTFWTQDQVSKLLHQHNASISNEVIKDIHQRTAGHAGLVGLCAKAITDLDPLMATNFDTWIQFANTELITIMKNWQIMSRMIAQLALTNNNTDNSKEEIDMAVKARKFLRMVMAGGLKPLKVNTKETIELGEYLVNLGALIAVKKNTFKVPSPLMYTLLSTEVLSVDKHNLPELPAPEFFEPVFVPKIFAFMENSFDEQTMASAYTHATKKSQMPGEFSRKNVLIESVYLAEVYSILKAWLSPLVTILPQVNHLGSRLLMYQGDRKCVTEFVANATAAEISAKFKQAHDYAMQVKAQDVWLVHFTVENESEQFFKYPTTSAEYPYINVMHIVHNYEPFQVLKTSLAIQGNGSGCPYK